MACTLEHALAARGKMTVLLDGDNVRHGLNKNLGFTGRWGPGGVRSAAQHSAAFDGRP